jgi:response regulator RpfG family c-di-GMP phosphodiesterase
MPEMNGIEFLAEARKMAPKTPRMMLTAFPDLDLAISALNRERIEKFLVKPIDPDELVAAVRAILSTGQENAERLRHHARSLDALRREMMEK